MRIDERLEAHVREAYAGVVASDGDRMAAAFHGLSDEDFQRCLAYAMFVVGFIVHDVFPDGPDEESYTQLAQEVVEGEKEWIDAGPVETVTSFMRVAATGKRVFEDVAVEDLVGLAFVAGGHLLATYYEEGTHWWDYLDRIWAHAEAEPSE